MWQLSGFVSGKADVQEAMHRLQAHLVAVPAKYQKFSATELVEPLAPKKWSRQEILGHLIDSALNNLKRFTDIQFSPQPYTVISYKQDELVVVNNYNRLPLNHLLELWTTLNRQIIYVVENMTSEILSLQVNPNYDDGQLRSLEWVITDYVAHLEHHLLQAAGQKA